MNEGVRIVVVGLAAAVSLVALFLAVSALFARKVEQARRAADDVPVRAFFIGAANVLFLSAFAAGLSAVADNTGVEVLQLPALLIFSLVVILLVFGLTAVSLLVGERLFPAASAFRSRAGGGAVLALASLAPFVGWFGFFPYASFLGAGAFILGLFREGAAPTLATARPKAGSEAEPDPPAQPS